MRWPLPPSPTIPKPRRSARCRRRAEKITLEFEHVEVCNAIERAAAARDRINAVLLAHARQRWPGRWLDFRPLPFRFATWVGYDMDGRTDIGWTTSIAFRLREKARRLASYAAGLRSIDAGHPLVETLDAAQAHASQMAELFFRTADRTRCPRRRGQPDDGGRSRQAAVAGPDHRAA